MSNCATKKPKPVQGTMFKIMENRNKPEQAAVLKLELLWRRLHYTQPELNKKVKGL